MNGLGNDGMSHPIVVVSDASAISDEVVKGQLQDVVISGLRSSVGQELPKTSRNGPHEEYTSSVLEVIRIMLGTPHKASFFAVVGLSGMGTGVIGTFLFTR